MNIFGSEATGADLGGGCRGCAPPRDDLRFSNTTGILKKKKNYVVYWCWSRARDECTPSWQKSWIHLWAICHFSHKSNPKKEKSVVHLHMSRILFAAKQSWTSLCMSRPLIKGSYNLQVMWWALGQYILLVCLVFNWYCVLISSFHRMLSFLENTPNIYFWTAKWGTKSARQGKY